MATETEDYSQPVLPGKGASDYERYLRTDELLALLPQLGAEVLLADPGRPHAKTFLERAAEQWTIEEVDQRESVVVRRLTS